MMTIAAVENGGNPMENDLISKKALLEQMDRMFLGADPADHEQNGIFKCRVLVKEAPSIEAEPVRHEGDITHITTDDLDKYQGMIIVDEGEKSKFCAVYYADDREHGRWTWITEDIYRCENCGERVHVKEVMGRPDWDYCPSCGAKMDAKEDGHE